MLDLRNEWTMGLYEVWQSQKSALLILSLLLAGFSSITYAIDLFIFDTNIWVLGVGLLGIIIATFLLMSLSAIFWVLVGTVWREYIPNKFQLGTYLKQHPKATNFSITIIFTTMFAFFVYITYMMTYEPRIEFAVANSTAILHIKTLFIVSLIPLAISIVSLWQENLNRDWEEVKNKLEE